LTQSAANTLKAVIPNTTETDAHCGVNL